MLQSYRRIFVAIGFLTILALNTPAPSATSTEANRQTNAADKHSDAAHRGFVPSMVTQNREVISHLTTPQTQNEGQWYESADWWVAGFTGALFIATTGLWLFTALLWRTTVRLSKDAEVTGVEQAEKMERSIEEAARSAKAMEGVAESMGKNTKLLVTTTEINREIADRQKSISEMQLRAYVSVIIGTAIYQETVRNLRFEVRPLLLNSGQTPAKKIRHSIRSAILPEPLPSDHVLELPDPGPGEGLLPPQQNRIMNAAVDHLVDDAEVGRIMRGDGLGLYVWGKITYEDAFDQERTTDFCQQITWLFDRDGKVAELMGYYVPGRNEIT